MTTQCLLQRKPKTMEVRVEGKMRAGVQAKDVISRSRPAGQGGGTGHVAEYRGGTIRGLSMEERMTVCNMTIEFGARAGCRAGRHHIPVPGAPGTRRSRRSAFKDLRTDDGAAFDKSVTLDASTLEPMITYGTSLGWACRHGHHPEGHAAEGPRLHGPGSGKPLLATPST